ncbi:MAG: carbohydrate kinase family protein [Candidatus Buchananbacteria bacterium]
MNNFDVVTIGGAVRDVTFYTDKGKIFLTPENLTAQKMVAFEYGAKIEIKESFFTIGGGAANTATSFCRLGFKTAILTRLGDDEIGKEIEKNFKQEGINTDLIQRDKKLPTGFSLIVAVSKGEREHIAFTDRGANKFLTLKKSDLEKISTKWFYLTSMSGKNWLTNLKTVFAVAKKNKIKIVWNPGTLQLNAGKKTLANFLKETDVLLLNKDEAIELVLSGIKLGRKNPSFLNKPLYLLNILQEWGSKTVVVTNGKKGAWAYDGKHIYQQKIVRAKTLNTIGVGDAFGSGFVGGLIFEKNINKALKWGMLNSGSVITKVGAQAGLLSRKKLLDKIN